MSAGVSYHITQYFDTDLPSKIAVALQNAYVNLGLQIAGSNTMGLHLDLATKIFLEVLLCLGLAIAILYECYQEVKVDKWLKKYSLDAFVLALIQISKSLVILRDAGRQMLAKGITKNHHTRCLQALQKNIESILRLNDQAEKFAQVVAQRLKKRKKEIRSRSFKARHRNPSAARDHIAMPEQLLRDIKDGQVVLNVILSVFRDTEEAFSGGDLDTNDYLTFQEQAVEATKMLEEEQQAVKRRLDFFASKYEELTSRVSVVRY